MMKYLLLILGLILAAPAQAASSHNTMQAIVNGKSSAGAPTGCANSFDGVSTASIIVASSGAKRYTVYAGNAFQLQRASDHTTLNIGWTGTPFACTPDTAAAATFCAATTCFYAKFYNQSAAGTGCDPAAPGIGSSESNMARYVASGLNGLPTQDDNAGANLTSYGCTLAAAQTTDTMFGVVNTPCATGAGGYLMQVGDFTNGETEIQFNGSVGNAWTGRRFSAGAASQAENDPSSGTNLNCGAFNLIVYAANNTLGRMFTNGATYADNTTSLTIGTSSPTNAFSYRHRADGTTSHNLLGSTAEIALFQNIATLSMSSGDGATIRNAICGTWAGATCP